MKTIRFREKLCMVMMITLLVSVLVIVLPADTFASTKYHLSKSKVTIYLGERGFLELLNSKNGYAKGKTKWKISDNTVLYGETSNGNKHFDFTPMKTGSCTITCTNNGKKYKCTVKVKSYKKKVKVIAKTVDDKGYETQLVRVQNCTKKKRSVYAVQAGDHMGFLRMSIPAKKYAYFITEGGNKYYYSVLPVLRINSFIMDNGEPSHNCSSKVKATINIKKGNKYTITYNNKSSCYAKVKLNYVLYNKDGKAVDIDCKEISINPHKKKTSKTYTCKAEDSISKYKAYVYAVDY